MAGGVEKALRLLNTLPRVQMSNLKPLPGTHIKKKSRRGQHGGRKRGMGERGQGKRLTLPRIGFEGGNTPFHHLIPKEPYYYGDHVRRQYLPFSLLQFQRLIDIGCVDVNQPIDLTALCNTHTVRVDHLEKEYGVNFTDEGADIFQAQVNIEVQWTSELAIAAIERNGGTILTKYYDLMSIRAMANPADYFISGLPIPHCKLPPEDALEYYSDPKNRGYLADPDQIQEARYELAQKYGYQLPDLSQDPKKDMLMMRKDPRQIWHGLAPGWVVNLQDKKILKPKDQKFIDYYKS